MEKELEEKKIKNERERGFKGRKNEKKEAK